LLVILNAQRAAQAPDTEVSTSVPDTTAHVRT
jgi:hypothetical protein